jgi:tRNA(Arg) A34 adenosine deaminase TadA
MCAWATVASGAQGIVIGASIDTLRSESGGSYDLKDYSIERLLELTGFQMEVVTGVLEEEVERAFREYGDWSTASPNVLRSGE